MREYGLNENTNKRGATGLEILLGVVTSLFVIGLLVMIYVLAVGGLNETQELKTYTDYVQTFFTENVYTLTHSVYDVDNTTKRNDTWLDFDGDDYVNRSALEEVSRSKDFSFIIYFNKTNTNDSTIFGNTLSSSNRISLFSTSSLKFGYYNGTSYNGTSENTPFSLNEWHQVVCRHDYSISQARTWAMDIFLDKIKGSGTSTPMAQSSVGMSLGSGTSLSSSFLIDSSLDQLDVYDYFISLSQINESFLQNTHGGNLGKGIPTIYGHKVDNNVLDTLDTHLDNFTIFMDYLNSSGFTSVTSKNVYDWQNGNYVMPNKPIIIQFDDGWLSVYTNATPVMDTYGFIGSFGITTSDVGTTNYVTWENLEDLRDKGWEILSHSITHTKMTTLNKSQRTIEFQESKSQIEGNLSIEVHGWIYPNNDMNSTINDECALYYDFCSGNHSTMAINIAKGYTHKSSNMTHEDWFRLGLYNDTRLDNLKCAVEIFGGNILSYNLNENTGTTAHDTSGNDNHGTITGATWDNDGVLVAITEGVDYEVSGTTFTLLNDDLSYAEVTINYNNEVVINDLNDTATNVIDGIGSVTDWFEIFIVITAMVVLILLTVIIITAIRGSGMMGESA